MNKLSLTFILFMTACNNSSKSPELKVESAPQYQKEYLNKVDSICTEIELDAVKGLCPNQSTLETLDIIDIDGTLLEKKRIEICKMRLNAYNCIK